MKSYKVWLNNRHIDTVFWVDNSDKEEVKHSLINHDGYDPDITVTKERKRKPGTNQEEQQ